jgi:hypothetical protein
MMNSPDARTSGYVFLRIWNRFREGAPPKAGG